MLSTDVEFNISPVACICYLCDFCSADDSPKPAPAPRRLSRQETPKAAVTSLNLKLQTPKKLSVSMNSYNNTSADSASSSCQGVVQK